MILELGRGLHCKGVIKNGTYGGRGFSSMEALENFLEPRRGRMFIVSRSLRCQPRRGRMFIVSRSLRCQPRRGGMSCTLKVYAAPNGARKSACGLYYNIAPLRVARAERSIAASKCRDPSPISNYTRSARRGYHLIRRL